MPNFPRKYHAQSGNVFLIILVAVVLFAALSYTIARGLQGSTTETLGQREIALVATNLMQSAQKMERGVDRIRRKGVSENAVSFADYNAAFANANCTDDDCRVFFLNGGAIAAPVLPDHIDWVDGMWEFHSGHEIEGIGTTCGAAGCVDLIATLHFTNENLCRQLNESLGVIAAGDALPSVAHITNHVFDGSFTYDSTVGDVAASAAIEGRSSACVAETSGCDGAAGNSCYTFYHVLLAR